MRRSFSLAACFFVACSSVPDAKQGGPEVGGDAAGGASSPSAGEQSGGVSAGGASAGTETSAGSAGTAGRGGSNAGGGVAGTMSAAAGENSGGSGPDTPTGLRVLASDNKPGVRCIGTAISSPALANEADYQLVAAREFNCVVAENDMKWLALEPQQGVFDFTSADALVSFAKAHDMKLKGHALLWHGSVPAWLSAISDPAKMKAAIQNHITTVMKHFKGSVEAWDVVNEAADDSGNDYRKSVFYNVLGADYIKVAFAAARAADPSAKLYYNDYNGEGLGAKSDFIYHLVEALKNQGVAIDGVGLQAHTDFHGLPAADLKTNMARLVALGLTVNLSEIDVRMGQASGTTAEKAMVQADIYRTLGDACSNEVGCDGLWVWGFTDRHSWVDGFYGGTNTPCLFDQALQPKAAYDGYRTGIGTPNLIANAGFEVDAAGWQNNAGVGVVVSSSAVAHGGSRSGLLANRMNTYDGPAYDLTQVVERGATYQATGYVRLGPGAAPASVQVTAKWTCPTAATTYLPLKSASCNDSEFVAVSGNFTAPTCAASQVAVYFEGPPPGVDLYVDDVVVRRLP